MKTKVKENQKGENIKEMKECKILKNNYKGITLIALVITIVVLLIIASVSIAMLTGDNGILTKAGDAKIETALGAVKEQVRLYQIEKKMDNKEVTPENLLAEGKVSRTVQAGEEDKYYMYYALKDNSFEGMQGLGKGNIASLKDVFLIDDNLNIKYIASNGREYGDTLNNKVLEDETEIRFSSKAFSEYVSKISGVTEDEMKFKWMKNQTTLTITDPNVESLQDLVFFPNLTRLYIMGGLTLKNLIGIENLRNLNYFEAKYATIDSVDGIGECEKLENFIICYGGTTKDFTDIAKCNNLKTFKYIRGDINFEELMGILKNVSTLKSVDLSEHNKIESVKSINKLSSNIENIFLNKLGIEKIEGLEKFTNLKTLKIGYNEIQDVTPLINNKSLEILDLTSNKIQDITPLSTNIDLKELYLKNNPNIDGDRNNYTGERLEALNKIGEILDREGIIVLDVDKLSLFTNYKKLDLSNQNLTTLEPLRGLTELTTLVLNNNKLTLQDKETQEILKSMKQLKRLELENNSQISDISCLNELKNLTNLLLGGCPKIDISQIEDILSNVTMRLSKETFSTLPNCSPDSIKSLKFTYTHQTGIVPNLSKFVNLRVLDFSQADRVEDFSNISNVTSLQSLTLAGCNMHGRMINFSKLTNLKDLNLGGNFLNSKDLENLKTLQNNKDLKIDLRGNSIVDASSLLELDKSCRIDLRNNVNLSQNSKDKLKAKFGNNVTF